MKIGVINCGTGSIASLLSALAFYKYNVSILDSPDVVDDSDVIVLTGMGTYSFGVTFLRSRGFWEPLSKAATVEGKPIRGLCLGMQLLGACGYENGEHEGLGLVPGKTVRLDEAEGKVPRIGWCGVEALEPPLFQGIRSGAFFFMHSHHFVPENPEAVIATAGHGSRPIAAAVRSGNILGLQFHPEKSQGDGLRILRNVMEGFACSTRG
jgi:glutamine amidotransferase